MGGAAEDALFAFAVDPAVLIDGNNVIAVEIHQRSGTSSDTLGSGVSASGIFWRRIPVSRRVTQSEVRRRMLVAVFMMKIQATSPIRAT